MRVTIWHTAKCTGTFAGVNSQRKPRLPGTALQWATGAGFTAAADTWRRRPAARRVP
jgi:hypothetical protein